MYKVRKVLNNNAVVVIDTDSMQESILIGTGIGFQKKTNMVLDADLTKLTRYVQEKGVDVTARAAKMMRYIWKQQVKSSPLPKTDLTSLIQAFF